MKHPIFIIFIESNQKKMNKKGSNSNSSSSGNGGENQNLSRPSSSSKKKTGLISSLYNNSSNTKQQISEKDLIKKYEKGLPIKPEDVLKLNKYTESKLIKNFNFRNI